MTTAIPGLTSTPITPKSHNTAPGEYRNHGSFAALRSDGSVVTWGDSDAGGDRGKVASKLNGTIDVVSMANPFANDVYVAVNTAPTLSTPTALSYTNTSANDSFSKATGTLAGADSDGDILTYGISDGTVTSTTASKTGSYGALSVNTKTGAYTFTPNDAAIEALTSDTSETYTVTVSDGTTTTTANLTVSLAGDTSAAGEAITGGDTNDTLPGSDGNDTVDGGAGNDTIDGGAGNDTIEAGEGNDSILGGLGDDSVDAGIGNDSVDGGTGADKLTGGADADIFVLAYLNTVATDADSITDFTDADTLKFDTTVFTSLVGATSDNLVIGKSSLDQNDYLIFDSTTGSLYYDADGSGTGSAAIKIAGIKGTDAKATTFTFGDLAFT